MTDPNLENCDDQIDRYVRGGLTPAEARELAQESLDDAELFEVLTYSALAKKAVAAGSNGRRVIRLWRPGRFIIAGSIAAAIAVYASLDALREAPSPAGRSTVHPTPDPARDDRQPILLANDLPAGPEEPPEIFRGAEPQSRLPRSSGTILAIDGGVAAIDIGAADGLTEGIELEVFRSGNAAPPVGYVQVTTVFRERARGSIEGGIRARDQVRIPAAVHLTARMERVHTLAAWGDLGRPGRLRRMPFNGLPPPTRRRRGKLLLGTRWQSFASSRPIVPAERHCYSGPLPHVPMQMLCVPRF